MTERARLDDHDPFPPAWRERWRTAEERIALAGYGEMVTDAYRAAAGALAMSAGPALAIRLAKTVSLAAIRSGRRAACLVPEAALETSARYRQPEDMDLWVAQVEEVLRKAPESALALLENMGRIVGALPPFAFHAFVRAGLASRAAGSGQASAFFALETPEALRMLGGTPGSTGFATLRGQLRPYMAALWGLCPPIAEPPPDAPEAMRRRPGLGGGGVRMPSSYPGFPPEEARLLYRAALAHIGAHRRHTRTLFPAKGLKPLQIALVSLIEDARVERLAALELPGLARLWNRFHVARPEGPPLAIALMARLSRALADPAYEDPHGFVAKGRALFEEAFQNDRHDQQLSRRIGGLLGNDIGQMRLQFDPRTYVVQPAYRDDNLGIWDFGPQDDQAPIEMEAMLEGARIEQQQGEDGRREQGDAGESAAGRLVTPNNEDAYPRFRYPEFDPVAGQYRPDWCTVREYPVRPGPPALVRALEEARSDIVDRLSSMIRASRVSRQQRVRGQMEGDFLDVDASISAQIARRAGDLPDNRVYGRHERRARDMSVLLLIDCSRSTTDRLPDGSSTVLEMERLSTAFLARAMTGLDDPFAIAGFASNGREDVRYMRVKDFGQPFDRPALGRLAGLTGDFSTRLGAVLRHAGRDLARQRSYRRLLLVVTDGEPSDIDVDDPAHLAGDARMAVRELRRVGLDVFCITLGSNSASSAPQIFGRRQTLCLNSVNRLPTVLPGIYLSLKS